MNLIIRAQLLLILVTVFLDVTKSNPLPQGPNDSSNNPVNNEPPNQKSKPRCLQSVLGWFAKDALISTLNGYGASESPELPESLNLQGGILSGPSYGDSGYLSQTTPGLPQHAIDAANKAQLMNAQLNSMNAQFAGGFPGSTIPLSPPSTFNYGTGTDAFRAGFHTQYPQPGQVFSQQGSFPSLGSFPTAVLQY